MVTGSRLINCPNIESRLNVVLYVTLSIKEQHSKLICSTNVGLYVLNDKRVDESILTLPDVIAVFLRPSNRLLVLVMIYKGPRGSVWRYRESCTDFLHASF